jgi:hypothetical protein
VTRKAFDSENAFDRIPVQFVDRRRQLIFSQEAIAEKIGRLNKVGDAGREQPLVKPVLAMR